MIFRIFHFLRNFKKFMRSEKGQHILRNVKSYKRYNNCFCKIDSNIPFKFKNKSTAYKTLIKFYQTGFTIFIQFSLDPLNKGLLLRLIDIGSSLQWEFLNEGETSRTFEFAKMEIIFSCRNKTTLFFCEKNCQALRECHKSLAFLFGVPTSTILEFFPMDC